MIGAVPGTAATNVDDKSPWTDTSGLPRIYVLLFVITSLGKIAVTVCEFFTMTGPLLLVHFY